MRVCFIAFLSGVLSAQVASIGVKSLGPASPQPRSATDKVTSRPEHLAAVGVPLIGYVLGPGPLDLHTILVTSKLPKVGELVTAPENSLHLYLPPRQQYVLVERNSAAPVALWDVHKAVTAELAAEPVTVAGAMAHPDLVAFSPRGDSVVLFSQALSLVQVITDLPLEAKLSERRTLPDVGLPSRMNVSDDGRLVVLGFSDGTMFSCGFSSANGSDWTPLQVPLTLTSATFVSNTHDLAVSDATRRLIALLPDLTNPTAPPYRVLAQDVVADRLNVTKDGEHILAANLTQGTVWAIDIRTGVLTSSQVPANMETLTSLRDGFSFLLSGADVLSVLKLNPSPQIAEGKR